MGKNQAYKQMQRAKHAASTDGNFNEAEDGTVTVEETLYPFSTSLERYALDVHQASSMESSVIELLSKAFTRPSI